MTKQDDVATCAILAMLLEVSATPKAGNVDRIHDFNDIRYEHFLASASSTYRVFRKASVSNGEVGRLILEAVRQSISWQEGGNVHFGTFLLLIPLSMGAGKSESPENMVDIAKNIIRDTTVEDSLHLLEAFKQSTPRVLSTRKMNLDELSTRDQLVEEDISLYEWMKLAPDENLIARELVEGFPITLKGYKLFQSMSEIDINERVVRLYYRLLSEYPDPLIIAKFGKDKAVEVMKKAKKATHRSDFETLDRELLQKKINPGTIADLTSSSLFLSLIRGLRF